MGPKSSFLGNPDNYGSWSPGEVSRLAGHIVMGMMASGQRGGLQERAKQAVGLAIAIIAETRKQMREAPKGPV